MDAKETNIYTAVLIVAVIVAIIIIYFFITLIRQQRRNLKLHRMNILAEITILEKERNRVASDLHDELGPMLAAIKMRINSFELPDHEDQVQLEKTNIHIDNLLKRMREISFDLMPKALLNKGLVYALKEFTDYINKHNPIHLDLLPEEGIKPDEQISLNLFRIIQEIIHNTMKHANATRLTIQLYSEQKKIMLITRDNGKGMDYEKEKDNTLGLGLRSILSRTEIMNGEMFLETKPGKGTCFTIKVPIQ